MDEALQAGRVVVSSGGRSHVGDWRVVDDRVEVHSEFGVESVPLGLLRSAPGTLAREKLTEIVRRAQRPAKPKANGPKFDIRDVLR